MEIIDLDNFVKLYGKAIYGFCHKLVNNKTDADDLYQETFLKALELCSKINEGKNPKGYIISIAIGLWKNNRRKYARRQRIAPTEELNEGVGDAGIFCNASTPEEIVISKERRETIQAATDALNDKLKITLYMYYTAEMSVEDIAMALKIPKGTVKSRLYKARETLKNILEVC